MSNLKDDKKLKSLIKKLRAENRKSAAIKASIVARANTVELVGEVHIDSGSLFLADAGCNTQEPPSYFKDPTKAYQIYDRGTLEVDSGYGDGSYPVYVTYNKEGRVAEVRIVFIE